MPFVGLLGGLEVLGEEEDAPSAHLCVGQIKGNKCWNNVFDRIWRFRSQLVVRQVEDL